jgi:hypothetical protein
LSTAGSTFSTSMNAWPVRMSIVGALVPAVKFWRGSAEIASVGAALPRISLGAELCVTASPAPMPTAGGEAERAEKPGEAPFPSAATPASSDEVDESRPHAASAKAVKRNKVVAFIGGLVEV